MPKEKRLRFWDLVARDREFQVMLLVATTLWLYTTIIKLPFVVPNNYTDVAYLWMRDVYQGNHNLGIPYVDYKLEYPPMIGGIIWLGQAIGTYLPVLIDSWNTYVAAESALQYPFVIGTLYNLYGLCGKLKIERKRIYLYILTTLTFIIYGFYNWDFVVAYFVSLSIWLYLERRFDASSLALTGGILSKFIPIAMAPAMVVGLPNNRARLRFVAIAAGAWSLVNAPFAFANFQLWLKLFTHTQDHQLQNTWISMVIQVAGLGDVVSGRGWGHYLSLAVIGFLILRALVSKKSPLEKILLSWYAWFGAIYLFDPQMFIELFPIIVLTAGFDLLSYRVADLLNAFIILFYFIGSGHPELPSYLTNQLTPFGLVNVSAAIRQLIILAAYFLAFSPTRQERLKALFANLFGPANQPTRKSA